MPTRISSRTTALWKWSSPVAAFGFLVDLVVTGEIRGPASLVGPLLLLVGVGIFVRRGREAMVSMEDISAVRLSLNHRPRRIVLELAAPTPLGSEIPFLPNAGPDGMSSPTQIGQSILRRASRRNACGPNGHARHGPIR